MKIKDLVENPKNPRRISDEKLSMLGKAMGAYGDISGIIYNRRLKRLVGGHQRYKNLPPELDITITETLTEPSETGTVALGYVLFKGEKYSYREVDWDEATDLAACVAANKAAGEWDFPKLNEILLELDSLNIDMELTMNSASDLDRLLAPINEINKGDENSEWVDMPDFVDGGKYINLIFQFKTELEREQYVNENNLEVGLKKSNQWIVYK